MAEEQDKTDGIQIDEQTVAAENIQPTDTRVEEYPIVEEIQSIEETRIIEDGDIIEDGQVVEDARFVDAGQSQGGEGIVIEITGEQVEISVDGGEQFVGEFENAVEGELYPPQDVEEEEIPDEPIRALFKKRADFYIEKDMRAISRRRRKRNIGRFLACVCVLIMIGTIVGLTAGAYTTADRIWWENVGEEAGVEFKELFTLFNGVVDSDEEKIITKGYGEGDLDEFYSNLKRKMFLEQDYDLSIDRIISSVMSSAKEGGDVSKQSYTTTGVDGYDLRYVYLDVNGKVVTSDVRPTADEIGGQIQNEQEGNSSLTGNEELDKLLQEIKFDFSSLEQYEGGRNILEISDRQLAAVINDAFSALAGSFEDLKEIEKTIGKPLNEVIAVKQIIISGNELSSVDTGLKLTLEVKPKDLLSDLLKQNGIPPIVGMILPEKLYASVKVYPYDSTKPIEASVNRLEESKVDKIVRIVDVILRKSGQTDSISNLLVQINGKVVEVLGKAQEKLPITFVPTSGSVDLYPIESLMGVLDVDVSEEAFLYMLRDIKLPTAESLELVMPTPETVREQTNKFVSEVSVKYCLDNSDGKISTDNTIKDVMDFASSEDALEAIRLKDMNYEGDYSQQLKVRSTYIALAGMLSDYVKSEGLMEDISADIVKMSYNAGILAVDIRVNLSQMLGFDDDSVTSSLIRQLVPRYVYVSANICDDASKNIPTTIEVNKAGVDNSKAHLKTLTALAGKFGMDTSSLTYDGICQKIDGGIQEGLAQMQEKIGCKIEFTPEYAYLPNLFEVVCGTGMLDEDKEHKLEPETLYRIMKQAYTFEVAEADANKAKNTDEFIAELESKYYLRHGAIADDGEGNLLQSVMELKDKFGTSINKSALAQDKRGLDEISPRMSVGEFAYLMEKRIDMENMSEVLKSAEVLGAGLFGDELVLYISANLYDSQEGVQNRSEEESKGESEDVDLSKYSNLLPQCAYVTLMIDIHKMRSASQENSVKVVIDGMSDDDMTTFFSIVRKLTKKSAEASEIEQKIDVQVKDYMSGVKGIEYKFQDGGLVLDNIFNVIAKSDMVKSQDSNAHEFRDVEIRRLLQELYGYDYGAVSGGNFSAATNLDHFIDVELYDKYFISDSFRDRMKGSVTRETLLDDFKSIGGGNFSVNNIRVKDVVRDDATVYGLTSLTNVTDTANKSQSQIDKEIADKFKPKFSREEIAYLLRSHVAEAGNLSFLKDQEVVFADNDANTLTVTLRGKDNFDEEDSNAKGLMPEYFYVTVTIDLINLADGSCSAMDVYAIDINSVKYVEGKGSNQDLELLLELIDRIKGSSQDGSQDATEKVSIDKIMQDIEGKLEGFTEQICNDVYTVSFLVEGGLRFNETVYQIALNSIYKTYSDDGNSQSDMPDEIDFRNGLCKVNNRPDKYEYKQGVFLDFLNGNRADNSSKAIAQINDKYALATPLQEGTPAILSILGDYAKNYAQSIDGSKLTSAQKRAMTVEQLRPAIEGEELLLMLETSVSCTADGYQNAEMKALYILGDEIIIVYNSPLTIDEQNDKFVDLLPEEMSLVVQINIAALDNQDSLCTQISINDLSEDEVGAIQSMVETLNKKDGIDGKSLKEANEECSLSVRDTMKNLTDNMNVGYYADETRDGVTGGGVMTLDSIYEVSAQKINEMDKSQAPLTAGEVKATIEALYDGLDIPSYDPPTGMSAEDMKISYTVDKSQEKSTNLYVSLGGSNKVKISGVIGGWNIASMIDVDQLIEPLGLEASAQSDADVLKLKHTELVPKKANGNEMFDGIRRALDSLSDNKEYFLLTLDMDMAAAAGVKMSILPERMDMTLCMDLASEDVIIQYNSMTERQRNILSRLVKTSRPEGADGLDLSNTDTVKSKIMDMKIIDDSIMGLKFTVTLGDLLKCGGAVLTASEAIEQMTRNEKVVLGRGAMVVEFNSN